MGTLTETATGISFPAESNLLEILGVGVRKKGPLKIYAVALYGTPALKAELAAVSRSTDKEKALALLREKCKASKLTILFEMNFTLTATICAFNIAGSVLPRFQGDMKDFEKFKALLQKKITEYGWASRGMTCQLDCDETGIYICIGGKERESLLVPSLATALCDVYLDDKCVSPELRKSCLDHCCAP